MKKLFASLLLGFGATFGVFVALAMPPGGWGVAVGVALGLLGCLPLLLVLVMMINRGQTDRSPRRYEYEEAPQPVFIIQPPAPAMPQMSPGYDYAGYPNGGYFEAADYYAPPVEAPRYSREQWDEPRRLPRRRPQRPQPEYYQPQYYAEDYNPMPDYDQYYDAPAQPPQYYDNYYGAPAPAYGYAEPEEMPRRPHAIPRRTSTRPVPARRTSRSEEAVEAEFRTIGDNE